MPGSPDQLPALSRESVRELDRRAIEDFGIPSALLMENAGRACADVAEDLIEGADKGTVLVVAGPGNNGGDGFVIARTLQNRGIEVELFYAAELIGLRNASSDVLLYAKLWSELEGDITELVQPDQLDGLAAELASASLVVDALFGTGLTRELDAPYTDIIELINRADHPILAVDLPSGLDANTGEVLGTAIRASTTVTFVSPKLGCYVERGPELCGELLVAEIGLPAFLVEDAFDSEEFK